MEIKDVEILIKTLEASSFIKCELTLGDLTLKLEKSSTVPQPISNPCTSSINEPISASSIYPLDNLYIIEAPLVGIFYSQLNNMSEPFISIGSIVKEGEILGVIEAMKMINEIESPVSGAIVDICIPNQTLVGYGQPLIKIKLENQ